MTYIAVGHGRESTTNRRRALAGQRTGSGASPIPRLRRDKRVIDDLFDVERCSVGGIRDVACVAPGVLGGTVRVVGAQTKGC